MNKRKLFVVCVLAVFIVGMTMASASAATYTIKCKNNGSTVKKVGKYKISVDTYTTAGGRIRTSAVSISKGNKWYKPYVKYYYTYKGKNKATSWKKPTKYQPFSTKYAFNSKAKFRYVKVKIGKLIKF
ncbi:MAG: hypothetical protein MJ232_02355 [archaeon]|nr:hypothetical protein [archaeon]